MTPQTSKPHLTETRSGNTTNQYDSHARLSIFSIIKIIHNEINSCFHRGFQKQIIFGTENTASTNPGQKSYQRSRSIILLDKPQRSEIYLDSTRTFFRSSYKSSSCVPSFILETNLSESEKTFSFPKNVQIYSRNVTEMLDMFTMQNQTQPFPKSSNHIRNV